MVSGVHAPKNTDPALRTCGSHERASSVSMIKDLRDEGVPVIGYTWFPLFTMIDWRYRFSQEPLENFYLELGLYKLNRDGGPQRWHETPLVEQIKGYISDPVASVGNLKQIHSVISDAPSAASKI